MSIELYKIINKNVHNLNRKNAVAVNWLIVSYILVHLNQKDLMDNEYLFCKIL